MKILFYFFVSVTIIFSSYSQNYKQIKIPSVNSGIVSQIASLGIDLEHSELTKDNGLIIFLNDEEHNSITSSGIVHEILIEDWNEYYTSLPILTDSEKKQILENSRQVFNVDGFD